ncbi:MAG: chain length determinant protein (polysaccharide antigen chain regulator) [Psychromonas sp.]|jgi:chain length determinant protein (polysaccharide antigen chain regulator)|uniref:Wzz/FepE/Etk N-terminal domain-containing protein n=1 Tax=Psychromonas sp. TaxID=1884585 RepID=UPI0039E6430C
MTQRDTKNNLNQQDVNKPIYQADYQDDEIDLRELIKVIWDYKWLTVALCTLAIIGSVFYALNAQEWWVAKGKVIAPQVNDVAALYAQSNKVSAILNANDLFNNDNDNNNNTKQVSKELVELFEPETLFKNFINAFNSSINKKNFLEKNSAFLAYLQAQQISVPSKERRASDQESRQNYLMVLNHWMKEINATFDSKTSEVALSFRSATKASSAELLNEYILFIGENVKQNQVEKFLLFVDSAKNELQVSLSMTEQRAARELAILLQKTEYAYQIASHSGLVEYKTNLNKEDELFQINLGEKALKAKINVLKSIQDLSVLAPSLATMAITLDALNKLEFADDRSFIPYRYLEVVEEPLNRAAPKRALIVILATLLAGMLSIFIALVHYFMTKKQEN